MERDLFTKVVRQSDLKRPESENEGTRVGYRIERARFSAREVAARCSERVHELWSRHHDRGLLLVGVDPDSRIVHRFWLPLSPEPSIAVIGRHDCTQLCLPVHPELSLRHVLVLARWAHERPAIRVLDLRTPAGFRGEDDERVTAVEADGPMILSLPGCALLLLPTGKESSLPDVLPRAQYMDKRVEGDPGTGVRRFELARDAQEDHDRDQVTHISKLSGIVELPERKLLLQNEEPLGDLLFSATGEAPRAVAVGPSAAERGVVLGRYARCDVAGGMLARDELSRVHALVIGDRGRLYLCDTGSTNGVFRNGQEVRITRLERDVVYSLASVVHIAWRPRGG